MPRTDAGPQRPPRVPDRTETADLHVAVCSDSPLVVKIRGEIDIQSAPGLRDELLRVIRRYGPQLALDLAGLTFMDCAGVNVLLATRRRAQLEEGSVRVVRASPRVLRMISLLGLERALSWATCCSWRSSARTSRTPSGRCATSPSTSPAASWRC